MSSGEEMREFGGEPLPDAAGPGLHEARMRMVRDDLREDAKRVDETPFTPAGIGATFGSVMACVAAVAETVRVLCEREGI